MKISTLFLVALVAVASCGKKGDTETVATPTIDYSLVNSFPHDQSAFTEGLLIHNGELFESTGEKESWIGIVDVKTGNVDKKVQLATEYFGEGISILNNKVYQLTWKTKKGFVYDLKTFKKISEFTYNTEGWGMTNNGVNLIMTDGTEKLHFIDTTTMKVVKTLTVTDNGVAVTELNEVEYVDGFIYANVWRTNNIVKIDIQTGNVIGVINLSALARQAAQTNPNLSDLNGIAWHPGTKMLLVTGKYWPYIYVLKLRQPV